MKGKESTRDEQQYFNSTYQCNAQYVYLRERRRKPSLCRFAAGSARSQLDSRSAPLFFFRSFASTVFYLHRSPPPVPLPPTMPQHNLQTRLTQAQEDILSAITEGPSSLDRFQQNWLRLSADFENESRVNGVDSELSHLAHSTASIISTLASSFLKLDSAADERRSRLLSTLENTYFTGTQKVSTSY